MRRLWPFAVVLLAGCRGGTSAGTSSAPPRAHLLAEPDRVVLSDAKEAVPAVLWNGRFGVQIGRTGFAEGLPMFWEGGYEKEGEEKIVPAANPFPPHLLIDGKPADPASASDYLQALDLTTGVLTTSWKQGDVPIRVRTWLDPNGLGGGWEATAGRGPILSVESAETYAGSGSFVTGNSSTTVSGHSEGSTLRGRFSGGTTDPTEPVRYASDIEIDGPVEDQQAIRAALHYLRTAVAPHGQMGVAPMGFSSDVYNGHVFWDADMWVFPALALLEPERAAAIPQYRLARMAEARRNYVAWIAAGRPTGTAALGKAVPEANGLKFPWESSVSGRETTPTSSRFEDHITGDVAWSLRLAAALGIVKSADADRALAGAAAFYRKRSLAGPKGLEIRGTMSPDENHTGNNDLFTNLLAQWCLAGGRHPAKPNFALPRQGATFLTYDEDSMRGYKQAAAILAVYPLQYPPAEKEAKAMLDRFEDKITKNGPAMSDSIHTIVHARLGDAEGAYRIWSQDWRDFSKTGLLLFSEKRNRPRTYFATGAGGMLQAVLFGFAGLRIDTRAAPGAVWQVPLRHGYVLSSRPNLPSAWKSMTVKGVVLDGKRRTLRIEPGKVTLR